ncbi:MAG: alpha/beta hydrolase-fold protein [Pseudomonadota bacterium]
MRLFALKDYLIEHYPGDDTLWVTFDHAGLPKHPPEGRLGWAVPALVSQGWEVVAIKARAADWFLRPEIAGFLQSKRFQRILAGKRRVILYGLSMGGFGAMVYASLIPGSVVLAISPQTTLDPAKVPWEKRFDYALGENWTGPFGDVDARAPAHAEAYVLYSPKNRFDGPQIDRLEQFRPITHLALRGNAHVPGGMLQESGLLKLVVQAVAAGPFSAEAFAGMDDVLMKSAAYHYHVAQEAEDTAEREAALERCLQLSSPYRIEFYRQRAASLRMREASKAGDVLGVIDALSQLRRCRAWHGSVTLKLMALRFLLRTNAVDDADGVLREISQDHPEGHPKLADLAERVAELQAAANVSVSANVPNRDLNTAK